MYLPVLYIAYACVYMYTMYITCTCKCWDKAIFNLPRFPPCSHGCGRSLAVKWALSVSINFMIHLGAGLPQAGLWLPLNL